MNHVSLALKYRPMRFGDLVGQEHVTGPLAQAVLVGRIAPAYLFSGSRGSGKTTTARILAKALNCTHRQGAEPCNECPSCVAITNGSSLDVIEIDGASNRGIDDIRDIRERVRYAPTGGGKKVYIVDEVHMLTDQAFNAFLKTLEEPPPHVVFVFATTDPDDLLETVRSRCQRYDFQRIGVKQAFERLKWIAGREKLDTEEAALHFLARRSEGSLRDALVLLDQAVNSGEKRITEAGLCSLMGHADTEFFFRLTDAVLARDAQAALKLLAEALSRRTRETLVFAGLCEHFRALMLARVSPSLDGLLEGTPEMLARYLEAAQRFPEEDLVQCLDLCLDGASRLERSPHPRFQLELLVVTLARLDSVKSLEQILARLESGGPMPAPRGAGSAPPAASPRGAAAPGGAGVSAASPGAGSAAPLPRPAAPSLAGAVSAGAPLPPSAAAAARRAAGVPAGVAGRLPRGELDARAGARGRIPPHAGRDPGGGPAAGL
ncbi:MAG: DNA polymerase III subunit gamma/tau [Candidatus Eisenbacteria bacterium]|nr:DNA polymerase III subunit gamma/tau [Candidatus Eisenbacteria bacterium]